MAVPCHAARVTEDPPEEGVANGPFVGAARAAGFVVVELIFGSFLVAGGVLSEPMVAATDPDKGGAVFVGDGRVGKVGLGG